MLTDLKSHLFASIYTQHRRSKTIRQSTFSIRLPGLAHMSSRPFLLTVLIVHAVHVTLSRQVIRRVDGLAVISTVVRSAAMSQIRWENEQLA